MTDKITEFFNRFAKDVPAFDGELIASKYLAPYLAVNTEGEIWECREKSDIIYYFQNLLNKHRENGVSQCKFEDLTSSTIGKKGYLASVTWTMMDDKGNTISHWRESYNLLETNKGLKVFTSMDH